VPEAIELQWIVDQNLLENVVVANPFGECIKQIAVVGHRTVLDRMRPIVAQTSRSDRTRASFLTSGPTSSKGADRADTR
jgi:hypothetical protein